MLVSQIETSRSLDAWNSCVFWPVTILVVGLGYLEDILAAPILGKSQVVVSHPESLIANLLNGKSGAVELPSCRTNPAKRRHHSLRLVLSVGGVDVAIEPRVLFTRP